MATIGALSLDEVLERLRGGSQAPLQVSRTLGRKYRVCQCPRFQTASPPLPEDVATTPVVAVFALPDEYHDCDALFVLFS